MNQQFPPGPPQGYPQGAPQQQPAVQQQPQYPQQAPAYWPQQQQAWPGAQQPQQPMMQQPPAQMPMGNPVSDEQAAAAYQEHAAKVAANANSGGPRANFVKWPSHNGSYDWRGTPPGFESQLTAFICQPATPGGPVFVQQGSHFLSTKQRPKGTSIICPGEGCPICAAVEVGFQHPDEQVQGKAKRARLRYQWLYNVFLLDMPQGHVGQDGLFRPFVLGAGSKLHKQIGDIASARGGISNIANHQMGRPIRLTKRKTGAEERNVEYAAIDMEPIQLPQAFWGGIQNIWDLNEFLKAPDYQALQKILAESSLAFLVQGGAAYNPVPQMPPTGNPYVAQPGAYQQQMPQQPMYQQGPAQAMPQQQYAPQQPMMPQQQVPQQMPPTAAANPAPAQQPMMPPPVSSQNPQPPAQPQQAQQPPPAMSPPAVQSGGNGAPAPQYQQQPSQAQPQQPAQPQQQGGSPDLRPPFDYRLLAQSGRERCFGKHHSEDAMCKECPVSIKPECQAQTEGGDTAEVATRGGPGLNELEAQLAGV